MAEIVRLDGNVAPFGSTATGTERTIFGGTTQSDTLNDNINTNYLRGWGVIAAGGKPPKQFFNGALYGSTALTSYLYQRGIAEWNTNQEFYGNALTIGSDGALYQANLSGTPTGNNPVSDNGTNWLTKNLKLRSNITVTVGSGGDYATINEALEYLSGFYPLYKAAGITATISLLTGFIMAEQVLVRGINLKWVTITGADATTTIDHTALTTDFTTADYGFASYPAFGVSEGGALPVIGQLFQFSASGVGGNKHGVMAIGAGSSAEILSGKGVIDAGSTGVYAIFGATINARSANASGAGLYGICASGSTINATSANASGAGTYGIYASQTATINANNANASGAGTYGIYADYGSTINAYGALVENQTSGTCVKVFAGSHIEATGINTTGSTATILSQAANTLTANGIIYQ